MYPLESLARGFLTRPLSELETTARGAMESELRKERLAAYRANGGETVNRRVEELAEEQDVSMAQIALAWILEKEPVDAPIIGVTS